MRRRSTLWALGMMAGWALFSCFATVADDALSLRYGTDALSDSECNDPAQAALKSWDRHRTMCAAAATGTADEPGDAETSSPVQLSNVRFESTNGASPPRTYRWSRSE